jgi:hypothetical protein
VWCSGSIHLTNHRLAIRFDHQGLSLLDLAHVRRVGHLAVGGQVGEHVALELDVLEELELAAGGCAIEADLRARARR